MSLEIAFVNIFMKKLAVTIANNRGTKCNHQSVVLAHSARATATPIWKLYENQHIFLKVPDKVPWQPY